MASDIERQWRERGWPPALLARARELHIPNDVLERMLFWNVPIERIEDEVRWAELLLRGTIRFRQLTVADNEEFCALWAAAPEELGEWDVTVERGPDGFAQFTLQERPVLNALFDGGTMVACVSFSLRRTVVGGESIWVRYGQAMRVHQDHRGHRYAHWVRSLPWAIGIERPTQVQYDYIRGRNMTMERWNRRFMPNVDSVPKRDDDVPGIPVTVLQYPANVAGSGASGIRPARAGDLEACVTLINRTHRGRDLFRPYTTEFLADRLGYALPANPGPGWRPVYTFDDLYLVERRGEIVACAGLWDRGRDVRERWRHRETGAERVTSATALLDFGHAEGHEDALAMLIEHLIGVSHDLGRDNLHAPLESLPQVAALLAHLEPVPETRYLQWRADNPTLTAPPHVDLVYW